jgi:hypothetical protein
MSEPRIYLSERGNDTNDGLTEITPVRTATLAVKLSIKHGNRPIHVSGSEAAVRRLNAELLEERKKI